MSEGHSTPVNSDEDAPDFLRLNRDMVECLAIAIAFVAAYITPFLIPFKWGPTFSRTAYEIDDFLDVMPVLLLPNLALHLCAYSLCGAGRIARGGAGIYLTLPAFAALSIAALKLTHVHSEPWQEPTTFENVLMHSSYAALVTPFCMALLLCLFAVPSAAVRLMLGILAVNTLGRKGYRFSISDCGKLAFRMGLSTMKGLPPREELALLPGYGNGTVNEIVQMSDEVQIYRSRAEV